MQTASRQTTTIWLHITFGACPAINVYNVTPSLIIVSHIYNSIMRTLLLATLLLVLLLDIFAMADDDIDRTFKLFKKKKEKVKDKIKKPSYKPDQRTFFKKKNKDKPKKPSYKPSYHPPSYHPEPYHPPSYHPEPYHGRFQTFRVGYTEFQYHFIAPVHHGPLPYPISATRHFGASVLGPHHAYPQHPHFGPIGYHNNFPF